MIDIFSSKFEFYVKDKRHKTKATTLGKCITLIVSLASFSFLMYQLDRWESRQMLPKITTVTQINQKTNSHTFNNSGPFSILYKFTDGRMPDNFIFDDYFTLSLQRGNYFVEQPYIENIEFKNCLELYPQKADMYQKEELCMDTNNLKIISSVDVNEHTEELYFHINRCTERENCKTYKQIDEFLETYVLDFRLQFIMQEFDYLTLETKYILKEKWLILDHNIIQSIDVWGKRTQMVLDTGILISSYKKQQYLHDLEIDSEYLSAGFAAKRYPNFKNMLFFMTYRIATNDRKQNIEYPKLPEILAQFISVFNTLAILGFIAKLCSEAKLFEQVIDIHINYYYKKVLYELKQQKNKKENEDEDDVQQTKLNNLRNSYYKLDFTVFKSLKNYLKQLFNFRNIDLIQHYQQKYQEQSQKLLQNESDETKQKELIYKYLSLFTEKSISMGQIYQEILELKTQVQMLYSEQEYAAVKYCSRNLPQVYQNTNNNCKSKINKLNHIEKLDLIDRSPQICEFTFLEFLRNQHKKDFNHLNNIDNDEDDKYPLSKIKRGSQDVTKTISDRIYQSIPEKLKTNIYQQDIKQSQMQQSKSKDYFQQNINLQQIHQQNPSKNVNNSSFNKNNLISDKNNNFDSDCCNINSNLEIEEQDIVNNVNMVINQDSEEEDFDKQDLKEANSQRDHLQQKNDSTALQQYDFQLKKDKYNINLSRKFKV